MNVYDCAGCIAIISFNIYKVYSLLVTIKHKRKLLKFYVSFYDVIEIIIVLMLSTNLLFWTKLKINGLKI